MTGQVDVGNLPAVQRVTSRDDPGRMAYSRNAQYGYQEPASFVVPANMRLVITHVSGFFANHLGNGEGDDFSSVRLQAGAGSGGVFHHFAMTFTGAQGTSSPPTDTYVFSEHTQIYADGEFEVFPFPGPGSSTQVTGLVSISGYLIDCSRTAPNCN